MDNTPCERCDVVWLEKMFSRLMEEHDKRYEQRFSSLAKAAEIQEVTAAHWRAQANEWRAAMDDRERQFLPKTIGYLLAVVNIALGLVSLALVLRGLK